VLLAPGNVRGEWPLGRVSVVERDTAGKDKHEAAPDNLGDGTDQCCGQQEAHLLRIGRNPEGDRGGAVIASGDIPERWRS
jgi:hypothetical protein